MSKKNLTKRQAIRKMRERRKIIGKIVMFSFFAFAAGAITLLLLSSVNSQKETNILPELVGTKQYSSAPPMIIKTDEKYFAQVVMDRGGEFVIQLFPEKAPLTVNNFIFLAREGYYDGVTFHRVLDGFMAQGGDPTGTGSGGPGYQFKNEVSDLKFDKPGVVAMANAGRDTNGSQFFIMFNEYGLSPSDYTIFGQVVEGMDVVNSLTRRDPTTFPDYPGDMINHITIMEGEY